MAVLPTQGKISNKPLDAIVGLFSIDGCEMGIAGCRLRAFVPQHHLNGAQVDAKLQQVSDVGVPQTPGLIESPSQVPSAGLRPLGLVGGNGSLLCQKPPLPMAPPT